MLKEETSENITRIIQTDPDFPSLLKQITDPPKQLFVRGNLRDTKHAIAIVGTRKPSHYGISVARTLVRQLVEHDITIVSGLALGIDAIIHEETLRAGGYTIAVLGSGIDDASLVPRTNFQLAQQIIQQGSAIISEYPPGTPPAQYTFPRRNRIIAGLCQGTLVIEAGERSGTLITATCALDYNRDVFAIPHQIDSVSGIGTNNLLKQGATLVTSAADILSVLKITELNKKNVQTQIMLPTNLTDTESTLYSALSEEKKTIDELAQLSSFSAQHITTTLTMLEIKGLVKHLGGSVYIKV